MPSYRVHFINRADHVSRSPEAIQSDSDQQAIQKAQRFVDGLDIELWQETRLVGKFPRIPNFKKRLERLAANADECDLISNLTTDPARQETYRLIAQQHRDAIERLKADPTDKK